jgi:hypothetical protein
MQIIISSTDCKDKTLPIKNRAKIIEKGIIFDRFHLYVSINTRI